MSAGEVTAKTARALRGGTEKNGFQDCFQNVYKRWEKCVTAQRNSSEANVV
jgi:hypothetical protein